MNRIKYFGFTKTVFDKKIEIMLLAAKRHEQVGTEYIKRNSDSVQNAEFTDSTTTSDIRKLLNE